MQSFSIGRYSRSSGDLVGPIQEEGAESMYRAVIGKLLRDLVIEQLVIGGAHRPCTPSPAAVSRENVRRHRTGPDSCSTGRELVITA